MHRCYATTCIESYGDMGRGCVIPDTGELFKNNSHRNRKRRHGAGSEKPKMMQTARNESQTLLYKNKVRSILIDSLAQATVLVQKLSRIFDVGPKSKIRFL